MMQKNRIYPDSYRKNLRLLVWLRSFAITGQLVTVYVTTHWLAIPLPTGPLWGIIAGLVGVNLLTFIRLRFVRGVSEYELLAQLLVDILALTGLLHYSGGAANPFASLYIVQVMIAAIVLPALYTWCVAALTIALYTLLLFWKVEVPYFLHHHIGNYFNIHVQGMWVSFILLALLVAGFIVRISTVMRRQDQLLAEAERIGAVGTLAAGAAHELGTPLATITLLAQQYESAAGNEDERKRAMILREQTARCKDILTRITTAAGVMRAESGLRMPLDTFLNEIVESWKAQRPDVQSQLHLSGTMPAPDIVAEYGLQQAIMNLLHNASDASPQSVTVYAQWTASVLKLSIRDQGRGLPPQFHDSLGEPGNTTKATGLGLGVFLARNVITRLGGALSIDNHAQGGVCAEIILPLDKLRV
jgi:two-component system, sensor histidine kinase RegB